MAVRRQIRTKPRSTLRVHLPSWFRGDRWGWRRELLKRALEEQRRRGVRYTREDRLEVVIRLYLIPGKQLGAHDVDNRLKDVLDALPLPKLFKSSLAPPGGYLQLRKLTSKARRSA